MSCALSTEYVYDSKGNLIKDLNRGISNTYNTLFNKPDKIVFDAESTKNISFVYDALGNQLQRIVNDGNTSMVYAYIDGFVYKDDKLLMFPHPEGRVRVNGNGKFMYDYFIGDNLGNIRTVITDETNEVYYKAQ